MGMIRKAEDTPFERSYDLRNVRWDQGRAPCAFPVQDGGLKMELALSLDWGFCLNLLDCCNAIIAMHVDLHRDVG